MSPQVLRGKSKGGIPPGPGSASRLLSNLSGPIPSRPVELSAGPGQDGTSSRCSPRNQPGPTPIGHSPSRECTAILSQGDPVEASDRLTSPTRGPSIPSPDVKVALLWDLDNVTAGVHRDAALAQTIIAEALGSRYLYAAGHRATYRSHQPFLRATGIVLLDGGLGPHGADRRLLDRAGTLTRHGVTHFVVASNDRAFARLPPHCDVTVLTLTPGLVSERLRARARRIVVLTLPPLATSAGATL